MNRCSPDQTNRRRQGNAMVEYGLLIATVAVLVLLSGSTFGQALREWFAQLVQRITTAGL